MKQSGWLALSVVVLGCDVQQRAGQSDPTRSEAATVALPQEPATLASLLGVPLDSLLSAGLQRYRNDAYDSARAIWNVELARTVASRDEKAEARVRMWLGIVAWKVSDYKTAKEQQQASITLKRTLGMDNELSRSFNSLGLIAYNEGRYVDALVYYDSAIAAARRNNDTTGIARASVNIPLVKVELGRFDEARSDFNRAIEASRAAHDDYMQANLLANLGMLEIRLGNPASGLDFLKRAREKYDAEEVAGQANALGQLATAWMALGDLQRGLAAADSAIRIARAGNLQQEIASNLEVLAELEMRAGNYRLALSTLHSADSLDQELGLNVERGMNMRRSSMILFSLGEITPALEMSMRSLAQHRRTSALNEMVFDRLMAANILFRRGNRDAAFAQLDTARIEAESTKNPATLSEALLTSASLSLESGSPRIAVKTLEAKQLEMMSADWRVPDLRASAFIRLERYRDARNEARRAVDLVEKERASLGIGPLRAGYLANRTGPYTHLVAANLAIGDTTAAFEAAALLPGRSLAERLSGIDEGDAQLAALARTEKLLLRVGQLERTLHSAQADRATKEQLSALGRELSRTRTAYEASLSQNARVPRLEMLGRAPLALKTIQSKLSADQGLLLYVSGEERVEMFLVRGNNVTHRFASISNRDLARRVRVAREGLQRSNGSQAIGPLGELHHLLILPFANELAAVSKVIVVPHGALSALPFAALWNRQAGRFFVQERSITYAPTVAAVTVLSAAPATTGIAVFAPDPEQLPGSRQEALAIMRSSPGAVSYVGRKSSKHAVRLALQQGKIVHIAAHGSHNSQNPMFSRVVVEATSAGAEADRTLSVHQIMGLSARSPLVFLSGCETGVSTAGEGVFSVETDDASLSQAFLFAGASSVIATLWPVTDSDASKIASDFYRVLAQGNNSSEALANAQRRAIERRGRMTWAAYMVASAGAANAR